MPSPGHRMRPPVLAVRNHISSDQMELIMLYKGRYRTQTVRLTGGNYVCGWYFVTICTRKRFPLFGKITDDRMNLTAPGLAAAHFCAEIPEHHAHAQVIDYVVMPNHMHTIIVLNEQEDPAMRDGLVPPAPRPPHVLQRNEFGKPIKGSLGVVVGGYKAAVTSWCRANGYRGFGWQDGYHEHIIRDDADLQRIQTYVQNNVAQWINDCYNPDRKKY